MSETIQKQNYKQTELGLIPEDWELIKFSDLINKTVKNSITGGPFGSDLKTGDYTTEGVQIIQLQNIGDGKFIDESIVYTSETKADKLRSCNIFPGEIILSKMGDPVARACIIPYKAERFLMASDGIRLVVDDKNFSKMFAFYYINSRYFRNLAFEISTGTTRQRIGLPDLKSLKFIKPPLYEQRAIATALSDVDELLTSLEQLISKKQAIKQGAMQELLTPPHKGGKRLPGFSGEWEEKKLGESVSYKNGAAHEGSVVENGKYVIVNSKFISSEGNVVKYSNKNLCPVNSGEVLMVLSDVPNGKAIAKCYFVEKNNTFTLNQRICSLISDEINPKFLYLILNRNPYFLKFDDGVKQTNLKNDDILSCPIIIPEIEEQKAIAQVLSDMDEEIKALEEKKVKYQKIKGGMMQELLTGKIRMV